MEFTLGWITHNIYPAAATVQLENTHPSHEGSCNPNVPSLTDETKSYKRLMDSFPVEDLCPSDHTLQICNNKTTIRAVAAPASDGDLAVAAFIIVWHQ